MNSIRKLSILSNKNETSCKNLISSSIANTKATFWGLKVVTFARTQSLLNLLAFDFGLSHFESAAARTKFLHLVTAQLSCRVCGRGVCELCRCIICFCRWISLRSCYFFCSRWWICWWVPRCCSWS